MNQSNILQHGRGDILVFLTGREEIDRCLEELMDAISLLVMLTSWKIPTSQVFEQISGEKAVSKTSGFTLWSQYDRADAGF